VGAGNAAQGVAIHAVGNAVVLIGLLGPPLRRWIQHQVEGAKRGGREGPQRGSRAFEPNGWLLWEHQGRPWVQVLTPIDQETTRLLSRGRNRYSWKDAILPVGPVLTEIADPFVLRKLRLNVKPRAEQLATQRRSAAAAPQRERRGQPWRRR
jgi:hypothetical protein